MHRLVDGPRHVAAALLAGLQGQIKARLISSSPQLLIEASGKNTIDDADAIVAEAQGHAAALRAAYAGGLALAAELPDDRAARQTIDLLTHALHDAAVRRGGATI